MMNKRYWSVVGLILAGLAIAGVRPFITAGDVSLLGTYKAFAHIIVGMAMAMWLDRKFMLSNQDSNGHWRSQVEYSELLSRERYSLGLLVAVMLTIEILSFLIGRFL